VVETATRKQDGELDYPKNITKKLERRRGNLYEKDKHGRGQLTMLEKRAAGWKSRKVPPSKNDFIEKPSGQQGYRIARLSRVERGFLKKQKEKEQKETEQEDTAVGDQPIEKPSQVVKRDIGSR